MARVGRPRTKIDKQEFFGLFAKMSLKERESALEVMQAVHAALSPIPDEEPKEEIPAP